MERCFMDNYAQISAELIIVLAAILAVAVMFISSLDTFSSRAEDRLRKEMSRSLQEQIDIGE